uniref:Uncharacterized protein n=1 Tax=Anguilla anguilla TaxID=7936 RepID=A0A0E9WNV6_ANGAN
MPSLDVCGFSCCCHFSILVLPLLSGDEKQRCFMEREWFLGLVGPYQPVGPAKGLWWGNFRLQDTQNRQSYQHSPL